MMCRQLWRDFNKPGLANNNSSTKLVGPTSNISAVWVERSISFDVA